MKYYHGNQVHIYMIQICVLYPVQCVNYISIKLEKSGVVGVHTEQTSMSLSGPVVEPFWEGS